MLPLLWALLFAVGCKDNLAKRFERCRDLVAEPADRERSLDCFTETSRSLLKRLMAQGEPVDYLADYGSLLAFPEVLAPPEYWGNVALLLVGDEHQQETILFVREGEEWRIDAFRLPAFWAPLDEAAAEGGTR